MCTPDSDYKCQYYDSNGDENFFSGYLAIPSYWSSNQCQCTNITEDGTSYGYCNPLGNTKWKEFFTFYFEEVLPFIEGCHILDRWNPLAWMDCGESITNGEATQYNTLYKEVSYYQWMQDDSSKGCMKNILAEYDENWQVILDAITDGARMMAAGTVGMLIAVAAMMA